MFVDADDIVRRNAIHDLVEVAEYAGTDIVRGRITGIDTGNIRVRLACEHLLHARNAEMVCWNDTEALWWYWYFTANLYRREYLLANHLSFPGVIRNEDPFFLCRCFLSTKQVSLLDNVVYRYRVAVGQSNRTAGGEYLKGWAMGYFYLYQLIRSQRIPSQYFLVHFPALLRHSMQAVRSTSHREALVLIRCLAFMFRDATVDYFVVPERQPWANRKRFDDAHIEWVERLKNDSVQGCYDYLAARNEADRKSDR